MKRGTAVSLTVLSRNSVERNRCFGLHTVHFGRTMEGDRNFSIRLGYSGVDTSEIKEGLGKFRAFIEG